MEVDASSVNVKDQSNGIIRFVIGETVVTLHQETLQSTVRTVRSVYMHYYILRIGKQLVMEYRASQLTVMLL